MSSPQGIFIGLPLEDLQALRVSALERAKNGDRTSLSGAGKSSGRTFSLSAADELREIAYAIALLTGTNLPMRTQFDVSRIR